MAVLVSALHRCNSAGKGSLDEAISLCVMNPMNQWLRARSWRVLRRSKMGAVSIAAIFVVLLLQGLLAKSANIEWQISGSVAVGLLGLLLGLNSRSRNGVSNPPSEANADRWRLATQAASNSLWEWDLQRDWLTWTGDPAQPCSFAGTSATLLAAIHPDDQTAVSQAMQAVRRSPVGTAVAQDFRVQQPDNPERWLAAIGQVLDGDRVVGVTIEITSRKQIEINLQRLNAHLEAQVQARTAELEQASELEGRLKRITDKVRDSLDEAQILQTVVQQLGLGLGVRWCSAALYDLDRGTSTICYEYNSTMFPLKGQVTKMAESAEIYHWLLQGECLQFCNLIPDPMRGQVMMLACPIADDRGVLGDLWLINDKDYAFRSLEVRLVQQVANQCAIALRQARLFEAAQAEVQALERLNWLKDEFLSTISHELRTPVANMKLAIRMLETALKPSDLPPKTAQYLQILSSECDREIRLISDLLDLQRLDAERRSLVLETIDLAQWLPQLIEPFEIRARTRQQQIRIKLPDEPLSSIVTDLSSLDRILNELLNNACKYTPPAGEIVLQVHSSSRNGLDCIAIIVSNSGIEIPAEEIPRIFDKFYRVSKGDPWKQGGTGLGLALVKRLIDLLEGSIQVTSTQQQTHFTIELPDLKGRSLPQEWSEG